MAMGADYSFELIFIETYMTQFNRHNKLFLSSQCEPEKYDALSAFVETLYAFLLTRNL